MAGLRSTLVIYNTADRLLRGDLFHTVTVDTVRQRLSAFPESWQVLGIGTTNWMRRNGEVIPDCTVANPRFWWADPEGESVGRILDVGQQRPSDDPVKLVTPQYGVDDEAANFAFLVMAICDPTQATTLTLSAGEDVHTALIAAFEADNWGVVGIKLEGEFSAVKTTDAYNIPLGGLNLSEGYVGDDHFRTAEYPGGRWQMNGVYAANPSIQPFISVPGLPLHLHGYDLDRLEGGHIVRAAAQNVTATLYPIYDLNLTIHNVDKAMNPVKPIED